MNKVSGLDFMQGGGDMGARMRAHDWSATSLGAPGIWSEALRTTVALLLRSSQPMFIWWGPELICFYNDAYAQSIGPERHPGSIGQPGRQVWQEIWDVIGPQIEHVMSGRGSVAHQNALVPITRHGRREEVCWTYSYNPLFDSTAATGIGGVLVICVETTREVLSVARGATERRHLAELFEQAPTFMAMLRGPEHRFELANPVYLRLVGNRDIIGRTVAEALPEAAEQGYVAILDQVYRSGEPYIATGAKYDLHTGAPGSPSPRYLDFVYQPIRDTTGAVTGIFVEGADATSRALAEAALRESEARFRDIADATPVLIWISDTTGTCIWFNTRWLAFTGRKITEEVGYGWIDGVHPDDLDRCVKVYNEAFEKRQPYRTEYRRRRYDGEWRMLDASGVPRTIEGEFVGFIGSCIDVTDQRVAARALSDREEQLRLATDAAEVGLWDVDLITDTLYWPARVKAMFGISADVPVSMADFYAGLHPDDKGSTSAAFAAAADPERRALYDVEYRTIGKEDGLIRWVAAKGRGVFRSDRCVRVIGTAIDISTRKAAEAQLRELNDSLEQRVTEALAERKVYVDIIESTDARVLVLDTDFRVLAINRATVADFERQYGVRPKTGDDLLALLDHLPERRAQAQRHWGRALHGEEFTATDEFVDLEGSRRYYEMKFNALRDRNGNLLGAFQFVYDISDRIRDQIRLAEAEKQLRQTQKIDALGQLTGGVAHDFNNLLMVISGGLSLLQRAEGTPRTQRIIDQMRQAADRGAALSRQLLTFARRQPLKAEPVDLRQLIDRMRDLLDRTLRGDVHVRTDLADDLWPIEVDPVELELVILNLCVNARDAMPRGGAITIGASNAAQLSEGDLFGEFVVMTVSDTGTGMSAEVLGRIFEPFFTTKEIGKGSGLGLAQVYGFAKESGGSVTVESRLGSGTVVTLSLPRSSAAPPAEAAPGGPELDTTARRRALAGSILLVEDDDEVAALVTEMLRELGYQVTRVASAQAALGALADDRALDLVFSDVMMPGTMSGVDLAREIRRRRPGVPVLLTTGFAGAALASPGSEHIEVLKKPYEIAALDGALRTALRRSRA
ncbi:MAG TPA: PAS domain S-box protein [Steroidobacteraceae bacterium]|nr:PAS domain S-box protein [Steroidobacteraceae bacterium]